MATSREILKGYFKKGAKPTERQFAEMIGAFLHPEDDRVTLGGDGKDDGYLYLRDKQNNINVRIDAFNPQINLFDAEGRRNIVIDGKNSDLHLGIGSEATGAARSGNLFVYDSNRIANIVLDGENSKLTLGSTGKIAISNHNIGLNIEKDSLEICNTKPNEGGHLQLKDSKGDRTLWFDSDRATIFAGKIGKDGCVSVVDKNGLVATEIGADNIYLTGFGNNLATISLRDSSLSERIELNVGGSKDLCTIKLKDKNGKITIQLNGNTGEIQSTGDIKAKVATIQVPDFILEPNYKILSIGKLDQFIKKHKHLPDIPSADQIKEEGINLTDFSLKLLQKIEELTLYVIDLQKQIDELKKR